MSESPAAAPRLPDFAPAPDGVDPRTIPCRVLPTGARLPVIGLGTFGSDRFGADEIAAAVVGAASVGYRHFDCAAVYGNEPRIGHALALLQRGGIARGDLFITSKVWNDMHGPGKVIASCRRSLKDLQLDYLDLYLVHWPFPNFHPPGCDVHSRSPDAKPYLPGSFLDTWRQMEELVRLGLVRHIGTSNMTLPKLARLLPEVRVRPACNEMELHPHFQQKELFRYVLEQGIVPIGFCPVGSPNRPDRDRTPGDTVDTEDPVIVRIAGRLGVHPATVCIKWAAQQGQVPIPFSVRRANYLANLKAVVSPPFTPSEMEQIAGIDRNCRLIKGQVFLWKEGQSWEDLWDPSGEITPP
jgi:diketogulonate reductase-like aldo/keto reductase